jgi:cytidylate kinase
MTSIAIDGPVASGKTAVGAAVARALGYRFIDTGVMYRAITWLALDRRVALDDEAALTGLAREADLTLEPGPPGTPEASRVLIDGVDVTDLLRSPEVGEAVSFVSRVPGVRQALVALQRKLAAGADTVMAGRDIGTVVLPDASLKVYLEASVDERVRRRHDELLAGGKDVSLEDVRQELAMRDEIDSSRNVSPLKPATDAIMIQTDRMSLDEVVANVLELAQCR